jgi:zinc protease
MTTKRKVRVGAGAALLLGSVAMAGPTPPTPTGGTPQIALSEWELPNGLQVLFVPVHTSPVVDVMVWYHAGSKDEPPHRNGMAHMFEHMMFKGSDHVRPEDHARMIDAVGGEENAFTTEDTTAFYEVLPKGYMSFALELEAERMRHLKLIQPTIDSERQVVEQELRQNHLDNPIGHLFHEFNKVAYTVHPYHEDAIGEKDDLDQVTPADCQKFYDTYYQPNNATVIVVGDVTEDDARKAVTDAFGAIPRAADPPHPSETPAETEPAQTTYREVTEHFPSQIGIILGGYHVPAASDPDTYPLEVLGAALSNGETSIMNERLVRKDKVAVGAGGQLEPHEDPTLMLLFGAYLDPSQADKVKADLFDVIANVQKNGLDAESLTRAKNQLAAQHTFSLEDVSGIATQLGAYQYVRHDAKGFLDAPARYEAVTNDDIKRVATKYLTQSNLTLAILPPGGDSSGAADSGGDDDDSAPASAPAKPSTSKGGGK